MKGYIDNYNFAELDVMRYWAPPATWSDEKKRTEVRNRIFSNEWYGAQKRDGALYVFLKDEDGNITLRGRSQSVNGGYLDKWDHLPHLKKWAEQLPDGCCFLGEVYRPGQEGSKVTTTVMGCLTDKAIARQAAEKDKMHYYVFDVLAWRGESYIDADAAVRFKLLEDIHHNYPSAYVEYAQYKKGAELWEMLQQILADGYEGIVITHEDAVYEPGKRPSKTTMKVKQELKETIDCIVIGANPPTKLYNGKSIETWQYWINDITDERLELKSHYKEYKEGAPIVPVTKNYYLKMAGSFRLGLLDKDGMIHRYGDLSGLTEEMLTNWRDYLNTVVEVGGMMLDSETRTIRHPKLIRIREDKEPYDCTEDQLQ
jgi:hypothetical protein